jgi:uncharacterized cupin superfamily protein
MTMAQTTDSVPAALDAHSVSARTTQSNYPEPFFSRMAGRTKRQLGDVFGLANFGVNLSELAPGGESALLHRHAVQDEFIYILDGRPTLVTGDGETVLEPGMCAGFPAGGKAHQLVNCTEAPVRYLQIGDRGPGDAVSYPDDDLQADLEQDGNWLFTHKDGTPY